jgi:hypothetical protein
MTATSDAIRLGTSEERARVVRILKRKESEYVDALYVAKDKGDEEGEFAIEVVLSVLESLETWVKEGREA